jgi:predicted PolB exonuclease-like 3'-5' exonuclease
MATADVFIVLDSESVPDGKLLGKVKYPTDGLRPEEAVDRARAEALERSGNGSDFLPVSFQYPVAVCVLVAGPDFGLQGLKCLDAPQFRTRQIVEAFWSGLASYKEKRKRVQLVTFNGRGFDLPLLEMAAFRFGLRCGYDYFDTSRNRFGGGHLDLLEWFTNFGACRGLAGGLDLLSKILGKPGKMEVSGDQVYAMHLAGRTQDINDYCMFDTIDTYFVFLRSRVMTGDISLAQEHQLVLRARAWLQEKSAELPALHQYLDNWGDWDPWP